MTNTPLVWDEGVPRSSLFGDIYYSLDDGLAESRAVYLAGCGLPEAWRGRQTFVVAELGFGTGLNIAALLKLWRETHEPGARLHIFSVEAFPPARDDAARALGVWPELAEEARALLAAWPRGRRGFHRIDLAAFDAVLDLAVLPVEDALAQWDGKADAWFLDGFSPALNPDMWTPQVMAQVAARSAPGAAAATFTVAGAVRRGLEAAGFEVAKRPGHGRKLQRLEARMPGQADALRRGAVAIIGAGIAGAALARAFRSEGVEAKVFADGLLPAASGNPAALVTPALDASGGDRAALYAQAFARSVDLYGAMPSAVSSRGALQKAVVERDEARFAAVADQDLFDPGRVIITGEGIRFEDGLVVRPANLLAAWTQDVTEVVVVSLEAADGWRLHLANGAAPVFDTVILAAGWGAAALAPQLALAPVRGQASWAEGVSLETATSFGSYAVPMDNGVLFGATHDRDDAAVEVRLDDHVRNLMALADGLPNLAAALMGKALQGRAAVRVSTRDRLPIAGQVAPGLWTLTGLGGRGFTTAPLLAEHVAAGILGRRRRCLIAWPSLFRPGGTSRGAPRFEPWLRTRLAVAGLARSV